MTTSRIHTLRRTFFSATAAAALGVTGTVVYAALGATAPCAATSTSQCAAEASQPASNLGSWTTRNHVQRRAAAPTVTTTATVAVTTRPAAPAFILGTTTPNAGNTGIPPGTTLSKIDGDLTVTTDGATVDAKDIAGHLYIKADNVHVTRTRVRGWADGALHTYGLISAEAGRTGITIDRSELAPTTPTWWLVGIRGSGFTATRNNIHDTVDGVVLFGASPATVSGNYIHDLAFFDDSGDHAFDPYHPGWTHNDGVQVEGGTGHRITGNTLRGYASTTSGMPRTLKAGGFPHLERPVPVTVSPYRAPATALTVEQNWLEGGEAAFQMHELNAGSNQALGSVARNRLDGGQHRWASGGWYGIRYKKGITITGLTTNRWDGAGNVDPALRGATLTGPPGITVDP
jgi:hypothetical protein